jgi:hypothetical protein
MEDSRDRSARFAPGQMGMPFGDITGWTSRDFTLIFRVNG